MYSANLIVNSPQMAGVFRCKECHMNFGTQQLLTKHKTKFCVGSASDPDDLQLRRGLRSTSPQRIISPDDRTKGGKESNGNTKRETFLNSKTEPKADANKGMLSSQKPGVGAVPDYVANTYTMKGIKPALAANLEAPVRAKEIPNPKASITNKVGAAGSRLRVQVFDADDDVFPKPPDPDMVQEKPSSNSDLSKKLQQLQQLKDKRTKHRDLNDLEERMLLDKLEDLDRNVSPVRSRSRLPLSKHREIAELQVEYEQLREREKSTVPFASSRAARHSPYSRGSNSSMSIHLDDDYRRNPNADHQLRNLAETHGRQMEYLQMQNKDLEKQREADATISEIRRRLEGLGRRTVVPPPHDNSADLLRELRDQEARNQRSLDDLKNQLMMMNREPKTQIMDLEVIIRNMGRAVRILTELEERVRKEQEEKCVYASRELSEKEPSENNQTQLSTGNSDRGSLAKTSSPDNVRQSTLPEKSEGITKKTQKKAVGSLDLRATKDSASCGSLPNIARRAIDKDYLSKLKTFKIKLEAKSKLFKKVNSVQGGGEYVRTVPNCEVEKPVYPAPPPPPPPPPAEEPKKPIVFPIFYGKSLVAEISAIRQAYLQNGGNDPDVLAQMAQMQAEAQAIEDQMNQKPEKPREKPKDNNQTFHLLEMENERLIQELRLLQEQNNLAQNRRKSDKEDELERELRRLQKEHLEKMYGLQQEMNDLRVLLMMERNRPPPPAPPQTVIQQAAQPPVSLKPYVEVEPMAPYDQYAGFVIFYDFVLTLDPTIQAVRLIVGLHSSAAVMGEPTVLPTVYAEPATRGDKYNYNFSNAVVGAKQPVPRCPPEPDLGIVVELQASGGPASEHDRHSLITRAWAKVPLFDNTGRLLAGRFRIPLRNVPIKPFLHVSQVQKIHKYGDAELYYRIVNMRDAEIHSMQQISASQYNQYTLPQQIDQAIPVYSSKRNIPPPPSASPLPSPRRSKAPSAQSGQLTPRDRLPSIQRRAGRSTSPPQIMALQDMTLGFQVDRVKHAEPGEGKVRITAYYASTGKVVQSITSPVTCSTTAVRSNFKYGYHVFGQQEASFQEVDFQGDMVLIARLYLKKRHTDTIDDFVMPEQGGQEASLYDEETLVAWATLPLVNCDENMSTKKRRTFDPNKMAINIGTHTMPLYEPPAPDPSQVPADHIPHPRDWVRYGKASLRVYVFQGQPRPGSLTPSDLSDIEDEDTLPEFAWLPMERKIPPKDPFLKGDGFDIYIDGCRFLPDSVTFTKVAGRILDRRYEVYGKDINTGIKLDSDVYNPVYEEKTEFRETDIPPTATLLLKVYTMDNFYKTLTVVGYATVNVFVETGTERQPTVDKPMQVSLNEGAHQLRLFSQGPNGVDPLTENCLRDSGVRIVPCSSLLIRMVKIVRGAGGKALESSKVPHSDWLRMGLMQPRPKYTDRVYYSSKCMPTKGETRLFHSMMRRTRRSIREIMALVASAKESFLRSDKNIEEFIRNQLTKAPDARPLDQDLNFICQYSPKNGIKLAVDSAVNLPWSNFTHCHMCLNPPAAFYLGAPHATYDKLSFTEQLDMRSTNNSPAWKDGFMHFPRRSYHRFLTMIIHLQEIQVSVAKENYKYGLLEQAWTAVQIFTDKYCTTQAYQLPLFAGSPSQTILKQLAREPCKEWMERNIRHNGIHLLEGTSIFVRVADARRDDELVSDIAHNKLVEVNTDYIPVGLEESYSRERPGKPLETLVPVGKTPEHFSDNLRTKFKSLVYKLYEEGNVTM